MWNNGRAAHSFTLPFFLRKAIGLESDNPESEEELKSLLMNVKKESEKAGLKLNIQKMKVIASDPITSRQVDGENVETVRFRFLGLQNQCGW